MPYSSLGPGHDHGGEPLGRIWMRAEDFFLEFRLGDSAKMEAKKAL